MFLLKLLFMQSLGGQVGDKGTIRLEDSIFKVDDTRQQSDAYLHIGKVQKGEFKKGQTVEAVIDVSHRQAVRLNHSATHLLHAALRQVLGNHVQQKGSLVAADRLRFDFSHPKAMTKNEIRSVEEIVNAEIRKNHEVSTTESTPDEAKESGAIAFFGERYGESVRVLTMGDFSKEICGGTHVTRTGDIGFFKITTETACSSGVRRIEAVTGEVALGYVFKQEDTLDYLANLLKTSSVHVKSKLAQLIEENKKLMRALSSAKQHSANKQLANLEERAVKVGDFNVLAVKLEGVDRDTLRGTLDQLMQQLGSAAIVLGVAEHDKIQLVSAVSKDCLAYFTAVELLNFVALQVGGKGGGRPDMAQGGGTDVEKLTPVLATVTDWVKKKIV